MTQSTLKYSFEIDGNICGQMDVYSSSDHLRTVTEFETTATGYVLAEFEVIFDRLDVIKARKRPLDWVVFSNLPNNAFPDCAYPLLIQRSLISDFEYLCVDIEQEKGHVLHQIARSDDLILEMCNNRVLRRFLIKDGVPTWIDWGGAHSNLL